MSECNWPTCGCQNVHGAAWCKASFTAHPSVTSTVTQPSPALAVLAMRERAAGEMDIAAHVMSQYGSYVEKRTYQSAAKQIRTLPTTFTNAELLSAVEQFPAVRALVEAADDLNEAISATNKFGDRSLTIKGPTANLKWLIGASDDTRAALAPFRKVDE